jgi:hemoglobin
MPSQTITRETIEEMVIRFYRRVLKDETVGPFFIAKLGEDMNNEHWKPHLELLVNFWSSIALGDNSYYGNPFAPHLSIGALKRETFEQWLKLFHETLDEVYEPEVSLLFKERSTIIAGNFMRNLGLY